MKKLPNSRELIFSLLISLWYTKFDFSTFTTKIILGKVSHIQPTTINKLFNTNILSLFNFIAARANVKILIGTSNMYNVLASMWYSVPIVGISDKSEYDKHISKFKLGEVVKDVSDLRVIVAEVIHSE